MTRKIVLALIFFSKLKVLLHCPIFITRIYKMAVIEKMIRLKGSFYLVKNVYNLKGILGKYMSTLWL